MTQRPSFLYFVEKIDSSVTVKHKGLGGAAVRHPFFGHVASAFELKDKDAGRAQVGMPRADTCPICCDLLLKERDVEKRAI